MDRNYMLAILFMVTTIPGYTQTTIKGKVASVNGEPIPGANVFLENTYDGSTTDSEGHFEFKSDIKGLGNLVVTFIGYKSYKKEISLNGSPVTVQVALSEEINELHAVTINAGTFAASDESRRTIFRAVDIATTAGATADIAGALNTLPGTQKVGESGRLFVRGGDGSEARTFIDGLLVLNPYSAAAPNTPSRGRFLPFMFKGTSFSTGGYSAEYGQALSSALVLDSKDKSEITRTDIELLSTGGNVSHTQVGEKSSWAGKIQYMNIRPYFNLINQRIDWRTPPSSVEGNGVYRHEIGKSGLLKVYGNFNRSAFALYRHDIDDPSQRQLYDLTNNYNYINAAYKDVLGKNWTVRGGLSYTFIQNNLTDTSRFVETERGLHAKTVLEGSLSDHVELKTGAEVIDRNYMLSMPQNIPSQLQFHEVITASFVEADIYASNNFVTRTGARVEHDNLLNTVTIDPRLSMAYKMGSTGNLSLAYGKFRQSPKNDWLRINPKLHSEIATHYIASYQVVSDERTFRTEIYYKDYRNLVKFANAQGTLLNNDGYGYAKGIEFFWRDKHTFKNADYWISYSYLNTKRDYLNFPYMATPSFASAHNFSVVGKYFITELKMQLGATYSYASGRPYYNPNVEKFNGSRTIDYHDVSINIAYLPRPNVILYVSATNLLGRNNIFGYEFSNKTNEEGIYNSRPIQQPATRFLFVGLFITLSKEKSINQLPSL